MKYVSNIKKAYTYNILYNIYTLRPDRHSGSGPVPVSVEFGPVAVPVPYQ